MVEAILRTVGLSKSFGGLRALVNVTLAFQPGGITAIIGPNGSGKTTLLNVISGFLAPTSGSVFFGDRRLTNLPPYRVAKLGVVRTFQECRLFRQMSVLDNLLLATQDAVSESLCHAILARSRNEERHSLERVGRTLEQLGMRKTLTSKAEELSFGERRLIELARIVAGEPRVALLDEPTAGVHEDLHRNVQKTIERVADGGCTTVLVEHNLEFVARIAERVIVLDHGLVVADGRPESVLHDRNVVCVFLGGGVIDRG